MPVLAVKDPVKVGCSGVGGLARFQIFPGYTRIRRMRVQTESCFNHLKTLTMVSMETEFASEDLTLDKLLEIPYLNGFSKGEQIFTRGAL